jgi:hypothetical protein
LTSAEKNYSTTEKECIAIVCAILHLRPYLEGQKFIIRTEHDSLRWILKFSDAQGRLARWRLRLLEFDYEVQYHQGALHHGADMMSRFRSEDSAIAEPTDEIDTEVPCFALAHSPLVTGNEELHPLGETRSVPRSSLCTSRCASLGSELYTPLRALGIPYSHRC